MLETKQPIFIIGSPRSGTTMLQVLLSSHPQVATTVELTLFNRYAGSWLETWETEKADIRDKGWTIGLPMIWSESDLEQFTRDFLLRAYAKVMERNPAAVAILDKNPGYSMHTATIKRFLPRAKFIHMIRDGRDVACSLVAAKESMGFGYNNFAAAGALWRNLVHGATQARSFGSDYLELRYEDFLTDKEAAYRRTLEFCGLSCDPAWLNETIQANTFEKMKERQATADRSIKVSPHHYRTGKSGNWKTDFSPADRYAFDLAAGKLLRELGYATDFWWAETDIERVLLPRKHQWRRRKEALGIGWDWFKAAISGRFPKTLGRKRA